MKHIRNKTFGLFLNLFREDRVVNLGASDAAEKARIAAQERREAELELEKKKEEEKKAGRKAEQEEAKRRGKSLRELEKLKIDEKFEERLRDGKHLQGIDAVKLFDKRKSMNIDTSTFEFHSKAKLDKMYNVLQNLGVFRQQDLDWMKSQLSYAYEGDFDGDENLKRAYQFPADGENINKICRDRTVDGRGGQMFFLAFTYLKSVKDIIEDQQMSSLNADKAMAEKNHEPLTSKIVDKLEEVGSDLYGAIENRDYKKLALYGAAAWAFIAIYKQMKASNSPMAAAIKKYLPWAVGIYAGAAIIAPDKLKTLFGKGINSDFKDTAFENLAVMQKNGSEHYMKGVDLGLAMTLRDAKVKDLYRAMSQNPDAAEKGMVPINHASINRFFDPDLIAARPPRGAGSLTAKQSLYQDTSRRLYRTLTGLKTMYESHTTPGEGITFEEKFLSDTSDDFTLHALIYQLSMYASNYQEMPWDSKLIDQARTDLTHSGGFLAGKNILTIEDQPQGKYFLRGRYKGFPVIIKPYDSKKNGRSYKFFLANEAGRGAYAIAHYRVDDPNKEAARLVLEKGVGFRIRDLLRDIVPDESDYKKLKFDGKYWKGKITLAEVPEYGVDPQKQEIRVVFNNTGTDLDIFSPSSQYPLHVDELMGRRYRYGPLVVNKLLQNDKFKALNAFANDIQFEDLPESPVKKRGKTVDENKGKFTLTLGGGLEVVVKYTPAVMKGKKIVTPESFTMDSKEELKLVQSFEFRERYVESRVNKENGEFAVFDKFNQLIKHLPEKYVIYAGEYLLSIVTGSDADLTQLEGLPANVLTGTVADYYSSSLLQGKKYQMMNALRGRLENCTSLEDINKYEASVTSRLADIQGVYQNVYKIAHHKGKQDWSRGEFVHNVLVPLKTAGLNSQSYKFAVQRFENATYNHLGLQGGDALVGLDSHLIAAELMNVYSYYTIDLDQDTLNRPLDGKFSVSLKFNVEAEDLVNIGLDGLEEADLTDLKSTDLPIEGLPVTKIEVGRPERTSVNLDVRLVEQYFYYVETKITSQSKEFLSKGNAHSLPYPGAEEWGIMSFSEWLKSPLKTAATIDAMNEEPPLEHTKIPYAKRSTSTTYTPLEAALMKKYNTVLDHYTSLPGVESEKMQAHFEDVYLGLSADSVEGEPQFYSEADAIYRSAKTKSHQLKRINASAQRLSDDLFQTEFIKPNDIGDTVAKFFLEN